MHNNTSFTVPISGYYVVPWTLIPLSVIGIFTNVVTIIVIFTSSKLKSTFNYFIASLAVSDLTSAVISTLFLYRLTWGFHVWSWPSWLCNLFWALDMWTSYVTSTHILLFSILRFVSIQWPVTFKCITMFHAKVCILTIWLITGIVGAIPFGIWFKPEDRLLSKYPGSRIWPSCSLDSHFNEQFKFYTRTLYPIFFYIPIILISLLSVTIGIKIFSKRKARSRMIGTLREGEAKRQKKENQILLQLGLIVGSFLLGYITYSVYHLTTVLDLEKEPTNDEALFDYWFGFAEYLMLRVSECLNPLFYNLASSVMRKETIDLFYVVWQSMLCRCGTVTREIRVITKNRADEVSV